MLPVIGYVLREQNRYTLDDQAINAVEITFERAGEPLRVERYLGDLDFDYVSTHALKLSVGSPDPLIRAISTPCRKLLRRTGEIRSVIIKGSRAMELEGPRWGTS